MTAYLVTFSLAVASVGLWTLRVSMTSRGHRVTGSIVSMVEATTYVVAVSHLIGALDAPAHIVLYAGGVGLGTYLGLTLDRTISPTRPTTPVVAAEDTEHAASH